MFKYRIEDIRKRWDGAYVCKYDWEPRHPQDLIRAVKERGKVFPVNKEADNFELPSTTDPAPLIQYIPPPFVGPGPPASVVGALTGQLISINQGVFNPSYAGTATLTGQALSISQGTPSPSISADQYANYVVFLGHMNGTNNSTTFIDQLNHSITVDGTAKLNTTTKKYGTAAAVFDGSATCEAHCSYSTDWDFGAGDFTVEYWTNITSTANSQMFGLLPGSGAYCGWVTGLTSGKVIAYASTTGGAWEVALNGATSVSTGTWYHVAFTRSGNTFTLWLNGVSDATATVSGGLYVHNGDQLTIGGTTNNVSMFTGYLDDLRITKGACRYTGTFTPPTAELPNP